jgi:hypothetical protein
MAILTRQAILACNDLKTETVSVPEWGGEVIVRSMTGAQRDEYEAAVMQQRGKNVQINLRGARARMVAWTVVDENGQRLFEPNDVDALGEKNAAALDLVFGIAMRLSGMTKADVDELTANLA